MANRLPFLVILRWNMTEMCLVSVGLYWLAVSSTGTSLGYRYSSRWLFQSDLGRGWEHAEACWMLREVNVSFLQIVNAEPVSRAHPPHRALAHICALLHSLFIFIFSYLFCSFICVCILARCYCIHFIVQFLSLYPLFILTFCCCAFLVFVVLLKEV